MTELIIIIGTNIFIQNGKKINFLTLIKFHKIIIPPMIEKGSKNNIPKIIKIEFSDIKNNGSLFRKFNPTKKLKRQEYNTVNIVPNIINRKRNLFLPFIISISIIKSLE